MFQLLQTPIRGRHLPNSPKTGAGSVVIIGGWWPGMDTSPTWGNVEEIPVSFSAVVAGRETGGQIYDKIPVLYRLSIDMLLDRHRSQDEIGLYGGLPD